jgi:hypothetical protein
MMRFGYSDVSPANPNHEFDDHVLTQKPLIGTGLEAFRQGRYEGV